MLYAAQLAFVASAMVFALAAAQSYHESKAMDALYYCKAAYCPAADISSWTCTACSLHSAFQIYNTYHNLTEHSQGFSGYDADSGRIVFAFRGTSDADNWWTDFHFDQRDYPLCTGCKVHAGFQDYWNSLSATVLADAQALVSSYPSATVLVTGHSLGAAVSLHAALGIMASAAPSELLLYNFGEPRVGNPAFAAWAAGQLPAGKQFRVTHAKDPVPHVPPMDSVLWTYLHAPHELWYDNNGDSSYRDCADSTTAEDPNCSDSIIPDSVADHLLYLGVPTGCDAATPDDVARARHQPVTAKKFNIKEKIASEVARLTAKNLDEGVKRLGDKL